jgi:LacI family transcriptional regulator
MSEPPSSTPRRTPRIPEIAAAAGVSVSTVDRVLNERGSVSDALRRRVIEAARQLNARRVLPSVHHGVLHFDVVLPNTGMPYYRRLERALQAHAQLIGPRVCVHRTFWRDEEEGALLQFLRRPPYRRAGLLVMARDVARIRACLRRLQEEGTPVVTITSDIGGIGPHPYVGVDNVMAGRTVAYLAGHFVRRPGRVLLLVASMDYRDHVERVAGFRKALARRFPGLEVPAPAEHYDRAELAHAHVQTALERHEDVVAIYNTGSVAGGIQRALRHLPPADRPVWIAHEATLEHAKLMAAGYVSAVIDQDPETQALEGLKHLLHACGELEQPPAADATRFRVVTPENVAWNKLDA